jgi:hypothetical protein
MGKKLIEVALPLEDITRGASVKGILPDARYVPRDVSAEKLGCDVESAVPKDGRLRFIEVKGRAAGATTVTVTKNEILTGLNKPDDFILAMVEVEGDAARTPRYVGRPFQREPDFGVTSVNYDLNELLARAEDPA